MANTLTEGGRRTGDSRHRNRVRNLLAAAQVAIALVLLIASALMFRSFAALRAVPPGFERPEEVLTLRLSVLSADAPDPEEAARTHQSILRGLAAVPGVSSVSAGTSVAMSPWDSWNRIHVEGRYTPEGKSPTRRLNWIAPGYFATLQNPLLAGRDFTWEDIYQRRPVVMITENLAREYWGEPSEALGKRISEDEDGPWREIIGVVGNEYTMGVNRAPPKIVYFPFMLVDFWGNPAYVWRSLRYAIRVSGPEPRSLLPQVRQAIWSIDPNMPLADVRTLDEILADSIARTSFTLVMLAIAAAVSLVLGTIGVFGVVSYVVSQRSHEFGVRMALGARGADVSRMILGQGGLLALTGIVVGLIAAFGLTRLMSSLLFGVSPLDPATFGAVAVALLVVVLVASYLPARRAAAVDPVKALRYE